MEAAAPIAKGRQPSMPSPVTTMGRRSVTAVGLWVFWA
jgi:hypothetical protein